MFLVYIIYILHRNKKWLLHIVLKGKILLWYCTLYLRRRFIFFFNFSFKFEAQGFPYIT
jgi:hypothetical protein